MTSTLLIVIITVYGKLTPDGILQLLPEEEAQV